METCSTWADLASMMVVMQKLEAEVARVCDAGFFKDLSAMSTDVLRRRKDEAESVEAMVSYARRIIQGRLDTFAFDPNDLGLSSGETSDEGINKLKSAISSGTGTTSPSLGKFVDSAITAEAIEEVESEISDLAIRFRQELSLEPHVDSFDIDLEALHKTESILSQWRHSLFTSIDALRSELVIRYREDSTMVDNLLARVLDKNDNKN